MRRRGLTAMGTTGMWTLKGRRRPGKRSRAELPETPADARPPRVLIAVTDPFSTVIIRGHVAALCAAGAQVTVVTSPGDWPRAMAAELEADYVPVEMRREIAPLADLAAVARLVRLLRRVRPDVVNAGTPKAALLVLAAAAACRVPVRIFALHGLRSATLHGPKGAAVRAAERAAARCATHMTTDSRSLRDDARAWRIPGAEWAHIGAVGIDLARFDPSPEVREQARRFRHQLGLEDDGLLVGFVGRLTREKGLLELADAWRRVRDDTTRLVLVGPDETEPGCELALRALRADPRVRFAGTLTDMPPVYAAMDLLVLPTWREGLGQVLLEAAALSVPVVASRVTGCIDAVADGNTGTLVPPRDPEALAEAIRTYRANPRLRAAHGAAGRSRVRSFFDDEQIQRRQIEHYNELLAGRGLRALRPLDDPSSGPAPTGPDRGLQITEPGGSR